MNLRGWAGRVQGMLATRLHVPVIPPLRGHIDRKLGWRGCIDDQDILGVQHPNRRSRNVSLDHDDAADGERCGAQVGRDWPGHSLAENKRRHRDRSVCNPPIPI